MKSNFIYIFAALASLILLANKVISQTQISPKYSADANVNALASHGDTLIIGGEFNHIGLHTGGGALFTTSSDEPNLAFPKIIGSIRASTPDGAGGFYLYGNFKKETETSLGYKRIEHVLPDFSFDTAFSIPVNVLFDIEKLLYHNGLLYIGGSYVNTINGQAAGDLSALDVGTKQLANWLPTITRTNLGGVFGLYIVENTLYITGGFNNVGGQPRRNIAAITINTGAVKPWNFGANFTAAKTYNDIKGYGNKVIIGGYFGTDGLPTNHACAIVDTTTGSSLQYLYTSSGLFSSGVRSLYHAAGVTTMELSGDTLFTFTNGTFDTRITALLLSDTNRVLWARFFNITADATKMQVTGGALYVAGNNFNDLYITNFENTDTINIERKIKGIIKLNAGTGGFINWLPNPVGNIVRNVLTMSINNTNVFVGGTFSHVNGFERTGIAMLKVSTQEVLPFAKNFSGHNIKAFKLKDSTLYAAGTYQYINNIYDPKSVLSFNVVTGATLPWNPPNLGNASCIEVGSQNVFIGGQLTEPMGGANRINLFAIDRVTGALAAWAPNPNSPVNALHIDNGNLYAGGGFTNISNTPRSFLAAYDVTADTLTNWAPNPNGQINSIASFAGNIFIGGNFTQVGGINCRLITGVNAQTGAIKYKPISSSISGSVSTILVKGCYAIFGGNFRINNAEACNNIAVYDIFNKSLLPSSGFCQNIDDLGGSVRSLAVNGSDLFFGGSFTKTNSKANATNIERISFAPGFFNGCAEYISIQNGNWNNASTWLAGSTPPENARVRIKHLVNVTVNARCFSLSAEQGGILNVNAGVDVTVLQ